MKGEISLERVKLFTILAGLAGAVAAFFLRGPADAAGFFLGAAISLVSLRAWIRLSEGIGSGFKPSLGASALFLALRYLLIAALIYAIVRVLGINPLAMIVGLLASFAGVILELLYSRVSPGK
jgi:hypothetical protein